ncbi:D-2-hydroxyacid dehydrogenase [Aliikangiella sp. IMCC44359]|uniref:D-2-hydroxyacid dehydrogenase n=1 Tax=Aliikangiella sp. IMCC44359 TaxID=3459125 RepID=UPI00403AA214
MSINAVILDRSTIDPTIDFSAVKSLVGELKEFSTTASEDIITRCENAEIVITNKVVINADIMAQLPQLKLVCVTATGTNNVDLQAAKSLGIAVTNVSGYSTSSVTQYVFSYLLNAVSHVDFYLKNNIVKPWNESQNFCQIDSPAIELDGKKLGILGFGNLGQSVAKVAQAFGMDVLISERPKATHIREGRYSFDAVLKSADVYSIHCPLTDDTAGLFAKDNFAKMKRGCIFINTARGPIVDSEALVSALKSGQVSHAIIDVLEQEPPPSDHPLLNSGMSNLTLTHHIAWGSIQAQQRLIDGVAQNIAAFIKGEKLNRVD